MEREENITIEIKDQVCIDRHEYDILHTKAVNFEIIRKSIMGNIQRSNGRIDYSTVDDELLYLLTDARRWAECIKADEERKAKEAAEKAAETASEDAEEGEPLDDLEG